MSKAKFDFPAEMTRALRALGAFDLDDCPGYSLAIASKAGLLRLQPDPVALFARFETPAAAVDRVSGPLNSHSGKWNHYTRDPPTADDVLRITRRVWHVLPAADVKQLVDCSVYQRREHPE